MCGERFVHVPPPPPEDQGREKGRASFVRKKQRAVFFFSSFFFFFEQTSTFREKVVPPAVRSRGRAFFFHVHFSRKTNGHICCLSVCKSPHLIMHSNCIL